jgi:serine/threonine-protein kinase
MNSPPADSARLFELFDALADIDPATRAARLAVLDAESPELARRLRSMLEADRRDEGPFDVGVRSLVHALAAGAEEPVVASAASAGQQIGPYRLLRSLGAGGMGDVWLAQRDGAGFSQQVALKLLRSGRANEEATRRFLQERRILAELAHPSIARFIDGGITADGTPWCAMEYIQGVVLDVWVRSHEVDRRARVRLIAEIAEAVGYAQSHLVVHRDLKPSNVLIDDEGRAHLLDFGIAKLLENAQVADGQTTGWFALSPAYAAPEQILGERVSTATDVYALGVMLYELLTGMLPHTRDPRRLDELVRQAGEETIESPARRLRRRESTDPATTARTTFARIDADLDTVVMTALQRDPARRYAGASAFADDLRRWLDGRPVAARPDTSAYRMRKFVSRHRFAVGSASGVLLALIAGFGVALWQAREARAQAARAEAAAAEARRATAEAESMNRFISRRLVESTATNSAAGRDLTLAAWVMAALPKLDAELGDAPVAQTTLRHTFGIALRELGEVEAALPMLQRSADESIALDPDGVDTGISLHSLAKTLNDLGRTTEAREVLDRALGVLDALEPTAYIRGVRVQARTTLLRIAASEGRNADMLAIAERNLEDRQALYGADDPRLAVDYNNLSAALARNGRRAEAEQALRRTLELLLAGDNPPPARLALIEQALCGFASQRADWAASRNACARAEALCMGALGAAHPSCISVRVTRLRTEFQRGEAGAAASAYPEARRETLAASDPRDKTELLRIGLHLALLDRDWTRLAAESAALGAALADTAAAKDADSRDTAAAFAALARWQTTRAPEALPAVLAAAETLMANEAISGFNAAAGALAAQVALEATDPAAASDWRARGIARLARAMPVAEAEALWQRWQPREAASRD